MGVWRAVKMVFWRLNPLGQLGFSLIALLAAAPALAGDLTGGFMLLAPKVQINEGRSIDLLVPAGQGQWRDLTPFGGADGIELWSRGGQAVRVESVAFTAPFDELRAAELQAWIDGRWQPQAQVTGRRGRLTVALPRPVITAGLRLWVPEQGNTDSDVLVLSNWRIEGEAAAPPAAPKLDLRCPAAWNVFDLPAAATVQVELQSTSGEAQRLTLESRWADLTDEPAMPVERRQITLAAGQTWSGDAELRIDRQGPYTLTVRVYDDAGATLATRRILIGLRDAGISGRADVPAYPGDAGRVMPIERRLAELGCIWSTEAFHVALPTGSVVGGDFLRRARDAGADMVCAYLNYDAFEPLPGVYNLAAFDRLVADAREAGVGLSLGIWRWDFGGTPQQYWLADQRIAVSGAEAKGWLNQFSYWAPRYREHAARAVEVLVKRYQQCPEVWMWYPHPFGMVDHDTPGVFDASRFGREAYAAYLQKRFASIGELNAAYGTRYPAFADVPLPRPLWQELKEKGDYAAMVRVLDTRPVWRDYLDFWHSAVLDMRQDMFARVRRWDPQRGLEGMGADMGVGNADATWRLRQQYGSFDGDTGLNLIHYVRRFAAQQRYNLPLRFEDIQTVVAGRSNFDPAGTRQRAEWDLFQACLLGPAQFNYVFPAWDDSGYWEAMFANPRAKSLVAEAARGRLETVPVGYLHSFETDACEGVYEFSNISIYRWWLMNGFSESWAATGSFPQVFSAGGPLDGLEQMRVVIDDGSRVLPHDAVQRLVRYVEHGGRLVLFAVSGERTAGADESRFDLLRRLGYAGADGLLERREGPATLLFHQHDTPNTTGQRLPETQRMQDIGFGQATVSMPVQFYSALAPPPGGQVIGTIASEPGAVVWTHGKGQVLLLAGQPGSVLESAYRRLSESARPEDKALAAQLWKDAHTEIAQVARGLWRDAAGWAGIAPPVRIDADRMYHAARSTGGGALIYLFNAAGEARSPFIRVSALPEVAAGGRLHLTLERSDGSIDLGEVAAEALAAGYRMPEIGPRRFAALRLSRGDARQ